jgi:hypothetical protein
MQVDACDIFVSSRDGDDGTSRVNFPSKTSPQKKKQKPEITCVTNEEEILVASYYVTLVGNWISLDRQHTLGY